MKSQIKIKRFAWLTAGFFVLAMTVGGCASSKYQAVNLDELENGAAAADAGGGAKQTVAASEEDAGSASAAGETVAEIAMKGFEAAGAESESEEETSVEETQPADPYAPADETVVVTADVANVRESESADARIFAQLERGSALHRTGYTEKWSRVIYDGELAYVASNLLEVKREPETEVPTPAAEAAAAGEAAAGAAIGEGAAPSEMAGEAVVSAPAENAANWNGHIVAIDAGHQAKANAEKEPIGPGSDTMKAKMPEGSVGVVTGEDECELNLEVAKKLKQELENRGYQVVMIRDSQDVNLSNAERAQIANLSDAEIFIRLHANSLDNSSVYGALTMCMTDQNPYNASLHGQSYTLSKKIVDSICGQTGTKNRGVQEVDNLSVINWCEIPVAVVEMGFMSNPDEDRWLQDEGYREKIADGISGAVDSYFAEGN